MTTTGMIGRTTISSDPKDHIVGDQSEVAAFLCEPSSHGIDNERVERYDTHGAMVFLAGDRAYKVKRAVRYPYMDFSTLEKRRTACEKEITLNRRTAPDLYLNTLAIVRRPDGHLAIGGEGEVVEWAVVMRRFPQEALFDRLAEAGALTPDMMRKLTDVIARFHEEAERLKGERALGGGAANLRGVAQETLEEFGERPDLFPPEEVERLSELLASRLSRIAVLLDNRCDRGFVRHCHGDLHLRNICLIDGTPTLFDCIEFNEAFAAIDVLYDLAFLLMDLDHRGLRPLGNVVLNRYVQRTDALEGLATLPVFLANRALVRAKVSASAEVTQTKEADRHDLRKEARIYFQSGATYLEPPPPRLIAIGGLSGTGKTSLARALAPDLGAAPGALHLRSDVIRKELWGQDELAPLPEAAYDPKVSTRVFAEICRRAGLALAAGHTVIADGVYAKPEQRQAIEDEAVGLGLAFDGLWLEADRDILVDRVSARRGDASDADAVVVEKQLGYDIGALTWQRLNAESKLELVTAHALTLLR